MGANDSVGYAAHRKEQGSRKRGGGEKSQLLEFKQSCSSPYLWNLMEKGVVLGFP